MIDVDVDEEIRDEGLDDDNDDKLVDDMVVNLLHGDEDGFGPEYKKWSGSSKGPVLLEVNLYMLRRSGGR